MRDRFLQIGDRAGNSSSTPHLHSRATQTDTGRVERTIFEPDVTEHDRITRWLTADTSAFVDVSAWE
ncbi:DUF7511 domain-containing protein [Natronocalculus amylovorans]|uniref:DUF7511 domain-containing protein n=1 Tax=Natronocalculus amylovorans TaxID=2917812 RepID=A0AAE3K8T9_9EURY|nr:hypothetical protein [Natronocalculus amylovorans]MCL9817376.1 hypothetical protein [Natronocalculus amylovorans]NUE02600.1 hypothetical protein [Halorubraceae archaeon YAN]